MAAHRPLVLAVASLIALVSSDPARIAHAAWPNDPHIGNVPIAVAANSQSFPRICSDGSGGAFIGWHDNRSGSYDLYVQRVGANGTPLWTTNGVLVCNATGDQANATLVPDGSGGVIVTWHDYRNGNWDVFVQRLSSAGAPQWTANGVALCTAAGHQPDPQIVSDGAGGAIVAWADGRGPNFDIYARRVDAAGNPQWTANGVPVSTGTGDQNGVQIVSDGAGGAILAWADSRSGVFDIYAQRLNAAGSPQWTANGIALCTLGFMQWQPSMVSDGVGGAIVVWTDERAGFDQPDIWGQRVNASGTTLWLAQGAAVCVSPGRQYTPVAATDGAGGVIVAWVDDRSGFLNDIYAQRVSAAGTRQWSASGGPVNTLPQANIFYPAIAADGAGGAIVTWVDFRDISYGAYDIYAQRLLPNGVAFWQTDGEAICTAATSQDYPTIAADGNGGAIITWHDLRNGANDVYCQRVERFGEIGSPEPVITGVRDVPNDQGGKVKVSWTASYLDAAPDYSIIEYRLWRSAPASAPGFAARSMDRGTLDPDEAAATGQLLIAPVNGVNYAWELVGTQEAAALPDYSLVTATTGDSVGGSNPLTVFMVQARTGTSAGSPYWYSTPDSGYSVDDLAPPTPTPFHFGATETVTTLTWGASPAADFSHFRLYRGTTYHFVPGPSNLLAVLTETRHVEAFDEAYHYKLSAVDIHGNESGFAVASPPGTIDVAGDGLPVTVELAVPEPNPARVATRIGFDLPRATSVVLSVYDLGGRRVRELHRGSSPAGRHHLDWNLRDDAGGPVSSGVYLVRLEADGRAHTRRMITIR